MTKIIVVLHPSIRMSDIPHEFSGDYENGTIIDAISDLLSPYPQIQDLCLNRDGRKPGILYIAAGAELASLGMLEQEIGGEEIKINVVPVLHGG